MTETERHDISRLIDPDSPEILAEFAAILRSLHVAEVKRITDLAQETYRREYELILREVVEGRKCSVSEATAEAALIVKPIREELEAERRRLIDRHFDWFRGAVADLLDWWDVSKWNPDNGSTP